LQPGNKGTKSPWEDFGNFNYGATGSALKISDRLLLRAAGWAQTRASTSLPNWGEPGFLLNPWGGTPPYGDDPMDAVWIKEGIQFYKSGQWKK